jgi:dUTP pyrophosphatase
MHLKIRLSDDIDQETRETLIKYYTNYHKSHPNDSGIDILIPKSQTIPTMGPHTINLGIQCQVMDQEIHGFYLYPRSSLTSTPLMLANSVGIIDYDYRGNLLAKVYNFSESAYHVVVDETHQTKLFQICSPDLKPVTFELVGELNETKRGANGFGSTDHIN